MQLRLLPCSLAIILVTLISACGLPLKPIATTDGSAPAGAGATTAEQPNGPTDTPFPRATPTPRADQQASNMELVGALALKPSSNGSHADVAAYKQLAFVGTWQGTCPRSSVRIIDISDPTQPTELATTPQRPGVAMEDMAAMEIGGRDVLAIGLQACGQSLLPAGIVTGLELIDISDPANPKRLSVFETNGVHEFGLTKTPDGRAIALLAIPNVEAESANEDGRGGTGDLIIVDLSDPLQPRQIAEWGVQDDPSFGPVIARELEQGSFPGTFLHSVRAGPDGSRAFLSYWDAGVIILDIRDPAQPRYVSRTTYSATEEGNAHSIAVSDDGSLLVEANEDFSPESLMITSNALEGRHVVLPLPYAGSADTATLRGNLAKAGRGCPADSVPNQAAEDPYTDDVQDAIALIERGGCNVDQKIARAQLAGATGVIVYGAGDYPDMRDLEGENRVQLSGNEDVRLTIPAVYANVRTGRALAEATQPVTVSAAPAFDGWGGLRIFDLGDPQNPALLSTFATTNTNNQALAEAQPGARWSAHDPDLHENLLFVSWYSDGVRAIDISDPAKPREVGYWTGKGAPGAAPPVDIWGIVVHGDLVLASDRNFGLYILKMAQ